VRRSRPRFWKASDARAHATLHECLVTTAELLAPFCPFLADELHVALTGGDSVHLADWPADRGRHDPALAASMAAARRLVAVGRSARTDAKAKVRQPLARAMVLHPGVELSDEIAAEIRSELNVKVLEQIDTLSGLLTWSVVPNFRALGPRLGPRVNAVKAALAEADGSALKAALDEQGWVEVAGERLEAGDVEVRAQRHESLALAEDDGWAVALDLELDEALRVEGVARELVRALNDARKAAGLAIADRVAVRLHGGAPRVAAALEAHGAWIAAEVLAVEVDLEAGDAGAGGSIELDVDGERLAADLRAVPATA
jgi:isoleucyl-tRNA synthetase